MPELPEVETTCRGIKPHIEKKTVVDVVIRESRLRWPIPECLPQVLKGKAIEQVTRRAKYLMIKAEDGHLLIHLGMSGSLRIVSADTPPRKHDHVDIILEDNQCLRYHDPRRFGAILWTQDNVYDHALLNHLGPEPLEPEFTAQRLFQHSRGRSQAVKTFIMDNRTVVGVGNIYANEALFKAGIRPDRPCGKISKARYECLTECIKETLAQAIEQGGTTLRDFVGGDGQLGYFKQSLNVYGREGLPCPTCAHLITAVKLGNRNTFFCNKCQR